jgi:hypothetical protein
MTTLVQYINDTPDTFDQTSVARNIKTDYNTAVNTPLAGSSNIKFVNVRLTTNNPALADNPELNKSILLQAFSCNIGAVALFEEQK